MSSAPSTLVPYVPQAQNLWGYTQQTAHTIKNVFWRAFSYLPWSQQMTYWTSLTYRQVRTTWDPEGNPWWNQITSQIILGGLPLNNWSHRTLLVNDVGIKAILTMNQPFELNKSGFLLAENDPVTVVQWEESGVIQRIIPAEDMVPLSSEEADTAAAFIDEQVCAGHIIYVHCKAGVGRSPTAVMCYLMRYQKMNAFQAFHFVKQRRPTINLNGEQQAFLDTYWGQTRSQKVRKV